MVAPPHILVADDDKSIRLMLDTGLSLNGFRVTCVRSGREAAEAAQANRFDAVVSDIYMPDGGGLELVEDLLKLQPDAPVILMTAQGSVETAVEAVSRGAADFVGKPFELSALVGTLKRHLAARAEAARDSGSESEDPESDANKLSRSGLVGRSAPMIQVYKLIAKAARSDATVLITGESGTGKELVARAIHDFSPRAKRPFMSVNCSGLTDTLLESELFGYVRGAFTGAATDRVGLFEATDGGALFLDELASTSPAFQASLLRVMQSGEVRRVGSTQIRRVNVRVIGASNTHLRKLASEDKFRADLYYRLSVLSIEIPPLRERAGDVELLTAHYLEKFREPGAPAPFLTRAARSALALHDFPGNVRELENALRRAVTLGSNGLITLECLPPEIAAHHPNEATLPSAPKDLISDRPDMEELQRRYLQLVLEETGWNRRHAASILGLDRRTIQRLIARYKLRGAGASEEDDPDDTEDASL
ncbi:MAG: sigma-54-dependent Fis family transcriptional regulator [Acidobacteriota bacterium]|nr:sigma-54-dependent Fis family transcriptional regulator [Acidobacteriota bacterium]